MAASYIGVHYRREVLMEILATVPAWMLLASLIATMLGSFARGLLPRQTPGLFHSITLLVLAMLLGHLVAAVGGLPSLRLGELRLSYGLLLGALLLWLARPKHA